MPAILPTFLHDSEEPLVVSTSQIMDDNIPTIAGVYGGKRARDQIPKVDHKKIKTICCIGAGYVVCISIREPNLQQRLIYV